MFVTMILLTIKTLSKSLKKYIIKLTDVNVFYFNTSSYHIDNFSSK